MNVAKSLYLSGKIIYANDNRLNYHSYKDFGLRCLVCGEPVYFRQGDKRQTHFAHFKGKDAKQAAECELRASVYSSVTQDNTSLFQSKGQKLEIFQQHFLNIIAAENSNFYNDVQVIKEELSVKPGTISISASNLEKVRNRCIAWFLKSTESRNLIMALHRDSYEKDCEFNLREQSIYEVFDFLQVGSSRSLLETIVYFSIFKAIMKLAAKKTELILGYSELSIKPVKSELIGIIIHTSWLKALAHVSSLNKCERNTEKERSTSKDRFRDREYSKYRRRKQHRLTKVKIC